MKILVGLSGGVDSAIAALLLKQQGHEVIGATMKIWGKDGIAAKSKKHACYGPNEKEDIEEARKIAAQIGIKYYVFDCINKYEEIVLDNFKKEYLNGNTPNPCIWCNALVKFGVLPELAKEKGMVFDKFATGHYAKIEKINNEYFLNRAHDKKKDQSYFLYRLKKSQLENIIFPLGDYTKEQVRKTAFENNLEVAQKSDSQDFYDGNYNELLNIEEKIGNIVDTKGNVLAQHKGFWNYTTGQRKGLNFSSKEPMYVLELNKEKNEVIVGALNKTFKTELRADNFNWLCETREKFEATAKVRSSQEATKIFCQKDGDLVKITFETAQKSIAKGQSVVLYDKERVLGGGIITESF